MFASRGFFGSTPIRPNLTDRAVIEANTGSAPADAYVRFGTLGSLQVVQANTFTISDEWMTGIVTAAEAQLYELVVVKNSGTLSYGAAGTYNLGIASLAFGCAVDANQGTEQANCTFTIRRKSDSAVMASATMSFWAESSNA